MPQLKILWLCFLKWMYKKQFLLHRTSWNFRQVQGRCKKQKWKAVARQCPEINYSTYSLCNTFSAPNSEPKMKYRLSMRTRENDSPKLSCISIISRDQLWWGVCHVVIQPMSINIRQDQYSVTAAKLGPSESWTNGDLHQPKWNFLEKLLFLVFWVFFFFLRRYNFGEVLAFSKNSFHLDRFLMQSFQLVILGFATSLFTSSSHPFLGLPSDLVNAGDHSYTLLTKLSSGIRCTCPNQANLCALI